MKGLSHYPVRREAVLTGDWRGRIGLLWPHDGHTDDEFWAYLPKGVSLLIARFKAAGDQGELTANALAAYADPKPLEEAADLLRLAMPDVVVSGDHGGSFIGGVEGDLAQRKAMQGALGVPASTASFATVVALRTLGAKRLALTSPYPDEITPYLLRYLEAQGFAVVASIGLDLENENDIGALMPDRWHRIAKDADHAKADAVLLAGGGIRTAGILGTIEADLEKPVVSAPAALIWHALQLIGVTPEAPEHGLLFTEFGAVHADGRLAEATS
ncbi:MAG: maleate cis-trans isomerase family protein [Geminicoccales bacterium]